MNSAEIAVMITAAGLIVFYSVRNAFLSRKNKQLNNELNILKDGVKKNESWQKQKKSINDLSSSRERVVDKLQQRGEYK